LPFLNAYPLPPPLTLTDLADLDARPREDPRAHLSRWGAYRAAPTARLQLGHVMLLDGSRGGMRP